MRNKLAFFNGRRMEGEKLDYNIISFDGVVQETFDFKGIFISILGNKERSIITCNIENVLYVIDTKERILNIKKKLPDGEYNIDQTQVVIQNGRIVFLLDADIAKAINLGTSTITTVFGKEILFKAQQGGNSNE